MKSSVKQKGKRLISRRICGVMLRCSLLVRKSGVRSSTCSLFFENESGSKCKITVMQNLINPGLRPKPQPQGPNPRPQGSNPRFKTPIKTLNLNPSLEAQIPACKPIFQPSYPYPKSEPQDSSPSAKHRSSDPSGPADQYQALTSISQPISSNHTLTRTAQVIAPSGPLPLSPSHIYIHSHRGNGYR